MIRPFRSPDRQLRLYLRTGAPRALGRLFDQTAPELLRAAMWLCRHPADAEDLLQRTFLTVIQARQNYDPTRRALPWLCGILGNHARKLHSRRQRDAERLREFADQPVQAADPTDAAEHAELVEALAELRQQIGAPYCEVLDLHLGRGLEAAEIAAALGRPRGTVRAQLARGLGMLRERLPHGYLAGLVALAMLPPTATAASLATVREIVVDEAVASAPPALEATASGVAGLHLAVALLTVGTLAIGWWALRGNEPATPPAAALDAKATTAPLATQPDNEVAGATGADRTAAAPTNPGGALPVQFPVRGIVLDEGNRPVPGAPLWRLSALDWATAQLLGHSDAEGRFVVDFAAGGYLGAWQPGRVPSYLREPIAGPGELTLRLRGAAGAIAGRIFAADGRALGSAEVEAGGPGGIRVSNTTHERQLSPPRRRAASEADGTFFLDGLEPGTAPLRVYAPGHAPFAAELFVEPGRVEQMVVRLSRGARIEGLVRDAERRPVRGATIVVEQGQAPPRRATSGGDGRFVVDGLQAGLAHTTVELRPASAAQLAQGELVLAAGATVHWDPILQPGRSLRGFVVDANGKPMAGLHIGTGGASLTRKEGETTTASSGEFVLDVAEATVPVLYVRHGDVPLAYRTHVQTGDAPTVIRLDAAEQPTASIHGRIVDGSGRPVAATLAITNHAYARVWRGANDPATGEFALEMLPAGHFTVIVEAFGYGRTPLRVLDLRANEVRQLPPLTLATAGRAEVTLVGATSAARRVLKFARQDGTVVAHAMAEGASVSIELPAGRYRASVFAGDGRGSTAPLDVRSGETTRCNLPCLTTTGVTLQLRNLPAIATGRRIDVRIYDDAGNLFDARELATGSAADPVADFGLPPGAYRITVATTDGRTAAGYHEHTSADGAHLVLHCR